MESDRYSTTDLPLSAFLQVLGHNIVGITQNAGRGVFVFNDSEKLRRDILAWSNDKQVAIKVRGFTNALRDLKGLIGV